MPELRRHDPDDRVEITVEPDFLTDRIEVAPERSPPETVAEHDPIDEPLSLVILVIDAPGLGSRRQHPEIIRARRKQLYALRMVATGEICIGGPFRREIFENIRFVPQIP